MSKKIQNTGGTTAPNVNHIIGSLSHELRTPVAIISSNLQLLKSTNFDLDEDLRSETFSLCEEAVASVSSFLDDIQLLNSANKGELKKNPALFHVEDFIGQILNQPNTIFYQSDRIIVNITSGNPFFCTDEKLLNRIITGLIDNAFRFSLKKVTVSVLNNDDCLEFEISDEGHGIPADELELIYEPFYRCGNVKMISGNGLGLSIAEKVTACLKGNISINSVVSKGTEVRLIIPADNC